MSISLLLDIFISNLHHIKKSNTSEETTIFVSLQFICHTRPRVSKPHSQVYVLVRFTAHFVLVTFISCLNNPIHHFNFYCLYFLSGCFQSVYYVLQIFSKLVKLYVFFNICAKLDTGGFYPIIGICFKSSSLYRPDRLVFTGHLGIFASSKLSLVTLRLTIIQCKGDCPFQFITSKSRKWKFVGYKPLFWLVYIVLFWKIRISQM